MSPDPTSADQARSERLPFLLEIGSEEIPARFIPAAMADFERLMRADLEQAHLGLTGLRQDEPQFVHGHRVARIEAYGLT